MELRISKKKTITKNSKKYLYCEMKIPSSYGEEYVQFVLESKTLHPVLPVFSTLRNSLIDVKNLTEVKRIIAKDTEYKKIIDSFMCNLHNAPRMEAEKVLLKAFQ